MHEYLRVHTQFSYQFPRKRPCPDIAYTDRLHSAELAYYLRARLPSPEGSVSRRASGSGCARQLNRQSVGERRARAVEANRGQAPQRTSTENRKVDVVLPQDPSGSFAPNDSDTADNAKDSQTTPTGTTNRIRNPDMGFKDRRYALSFVSYFCRSRVLRVFLCFFKSNVPFLSAIGVVDTAKADNNAFCW
ncbi:unnamed protein product [Protopolystoma xenopodis]|uniref:Uncharacterized protein n=1 Tax=Protopolystoma xenopodis TaxID=117903 RepID=A0A448WRZ4_9PLAT|nr:unnamed protein product [Protopolystoma xenopodis]